MTYVYFDPGRASNGNGSFATPYNTPASYTYAPGNRYLQRWGSTWPGTIGPTAGGTVDNRMIFGVYDPVTGAHMDGVKGGAFVDATGQTYGFNITASRSYITLSGLEIYGSTAANVFKGSSSSDPDDAQFCWLEHCILRDSRGAGADMRGRGHKITNTDVIDNDFDGLFIRGNDLQILTSRVANNGRVGTTGDCLQLVDSSNFLISRTVIDHSLSNSKQAFLSSYEFHSPSGGRIEYCDISCPQHVAGVTLAEQKTVQIRTPGVTVHGCNISGGQYGVYWEGIDGTLSACALLISGSGSVVGVAIRGSGLDVENNDIVGNTARGNVYGIDHSSSAFTSTKIYNNTLRGWSKGIRTMTSGFLYSHNGFENVGIRNANSAGTEGAAGTGDVVGNLKMSARQILLPNSPLVGTGLHLGSRRDMDGILRQNPPNIGPRDRLTLGVVY